MNFAELVTQQSQSETFAQLSSNVRDLLSTEVILVGGGEAAGCLN